MNQQKRCFTCCIFELTHEVGNKLLVIATGYISSFFLFFVPSPFQTQLEGTSSHRPSVMPSQPKHRSRGPAAIRENRLPLPQMTWAGTRSSVPRCSDTCSTGTPPGATYWPPRRLYGEVGEAKLKSIKLSSSKQVVNWLGSLWENQLNQVQISDLI
jgi:hypothetical protein